MLVFFLIIGGLIYLATVYIKQKHGTFDAFIDEAKRQLSGDEDEDEENDFMEDQDSPPDSTNRIAPSPEEPDTETVPQPTQEQLSKWKELEEMCKPMGIRSMYTGFKVDEETGDFVPEYDNIDCCFEQPWENEGECTSGQQKQVRGILNEDLCDVEPEKEQMVDCCSYGEWENDGECVDGVQKQNRQIFNEEMCTDTTTTREIACCSYGEWEPEGACVDGNQNYTRIITNSQLCEDTSLKKTEPCCFPLDWMNEGQCKATGMQKQVRAHINRELCTGDDYEDVQELACCYRGPWETIRECDYKEGKIQQKRINVNDEICRAEGDPSTTRTLDCCKISEWQNDGDCDEVNGVQKQIRTFEMAETCPPNEKTTQEVPCCKRGPWNADPAWNGGVCNFDGKIRVLREIELFDTCRNNDAGDPENALTETRDCCHKSEWEKDGFCGDYEFAKQKYTRTITNPEMCGDDGDEFGLETEIMEDCCVLTEWENEGECRWDGTQKQTRELINSHKCTGEYDYLRMEPLQRRERCCYVTEWKDSQGCGFFEPGKQREVRMIENSDMCDLDPMDDGSSVRDTDCCDIGEWKTVGDNLDGQLGRVKEVRDVYNCPSNVNNTQYEKKICYLSGYNDGVCNADDDGLGKKKFSQTVINPEKCFTGLDTRTHYYTTDSSCDPIPDVWWVGIHTSSGTYNDWGVSFYDDLTTRQRVGGFGGTYQPIAHSRIKWDKTLHGKTWTYGTHQWVRFGGKDQYTNPAKGQGRTLKAVSVGLQVKNRTKASMTVKVVQTNNNVIYLRFDATGDGRSYNHWQIGSTSRPMWEKQIPNRSLHRTKKVGEQSY